jgi:hypothetical protein
MDFVDCASWLAQTFPFLGGASPRMLYEPTTQNVGKAELRCQPVRVLAALSVCLLFHASVTSFTKGFAPQISQSSRDIETDLLPNLDVSSLVVFPSRDTGSSHTPLDLARDSLVCAETEDLDSFEEDPGHPQALLEVNLVPLRQFSCHHSPRSPFLPFLAVHGLMSRRF